MFKKRNAPTGNREDVESARARLDQAMLNKRRDQDRVFAEGLRRWSRAPAPSAGISQVRIANPEPMF
jgi:hypothetical protein